MTDHRPNIIQHLLKFENTLKLGNSNLQEGPESERQSYNASYHTYHSFNHQNTQLGIFNHHIRSWASLQGQLFPNHSGAAPSLTVSLSLVQNHLTTIVLSLLFAVSVESHPFATSHIMTVKRFKANNGLNDLPICCYSIDKSNIVLHFQSM